MAAILTGLSDTDVHHCGKVPGWLASFSLDWFDMQIYNYSGKYTILIKNAETAASHNC
jgi:hypothetical protein